MNWKKFAADYLTFYKKDRIAVFLFLSVTFCIYLIGHVSQKPMPVAIQEDTTLSKQLDTAIQLAQLKHSDEPETDAAQLRYEVSKKPDFRSGALFDFDPNTLDAEGWSQLGLRTRTIKTILNYRSKGGRFHRPEDLKKIWGLPDGFYDHVKDHVRIADAKREFTPTNFSKTPYERPERKITVVEINNADTSVLIALPGIGSKLAQRIINFRDRLGGFYSVEQIGETYGLPDSTFQKLKPYLQAHGVLKKFSINTASKDELKGHPYIKWHLANAIVEYRNQHGNFKTLDELKNIVLIDAETYDRIAPYVSL